MDNHDKTRKINILTKSPRIRRKKNLPAVGEGDGTQLWGRAEGEKRLTEGTRRTSGRQMLQTHAGDCYG